MSTFRILLAAFILFFAVPDVRWVSTLPDGMFTPPLGPMMLFSGVPSLAWTSMLLWATYACAVWLLWGKGVRWSGLALSALLALGFGLESSFGKINHTTPFMLLPAVVGWHGAWRRLPVYYVLVIAFQFFTAAMPKIVGGWLQPQTHAAYGYAVETLTIQGSPALLTQWVVSYVPRWMWELADVITVAFESLFIVAMWRPRSLATVCAVALCFHIGVWYTLHIPATGYIVCYAYIWIAFFAPHALPIVAPQRVMLFVLVAALYAGIRAYLSPTGVLETIGIPFTEEIENSVVITVGGGLLVWLFYRSLHSPPGR